MAQQAVSAFKKCASNVYLEGLADDYARDTIWYSDVIAGGIHGIKPDGTKVGSFNEGPGGADMRDCYFNSVPSDGGDTLREGGEITQRNSFLFRARSEVPGMPIAPARFKLA